MLCFAGIDLTSSSSKPSAYALLGADLRIRSLKFLRTDSAITAAVERDSPSLVAIDAPLSLPEGLCCLNRDCTCQPTSKEMGRICERELARLGIPSYFTTKMSIIKKMVYRAIDLSKRISVQGFEVIEVYPYASKVRLWGKPPYRKTTREGLNFLRDCLSEVISNIGEYEKLNHDECDAIIAAYTAYLHCQGKTEAMGERREGLIYIPCSK